MPYKLWLLAFLIFFGAATTGSADGQDRNNDSSSKQRDGAAGPSLKEILDFLGDWETDDGYWVDPTDTEWLKSPDQESQDDTDQNP